MTDTDDIVWKTGGSVMNVRKELAEPRIPDSTCTWTTSGQTCKYPVGIIGEHYCIFHRKLLGQKGIGADGAEITQRSQTHTKQEYLVDAWEATYGRRTRSLTDEQKAENRAKLKQKGRIAA